jgi:CubicO group peptidase (beta-lactamase class C family)
MGSASETRARIWRCLLGSVVLTLAMTAKSAESGPCCIECVDALFSRWDKEDSPGAVVGVFKNGEIVYAKGYGIANLDYGIPLSPQTVLRTGSLTKQFVATAIVLLAEQGKLDISDNIRNYLPEMPD